MDPVVHFASDSHFGAGSPQSQRRREALFLQWLQTLEDDCDLYLLGDVFDFWLDYPSYMPKTHLEILYGFRKLQDRGVRIHFVGGNHDIWCAQYLQRSLGIPALPSGSVVEHQGRRLRLDHGDGILGGDHFYKLFRALVRNPVLVFLAKSLHPELLHQFATFLSNTSREKRRDDTEVIRQRVRRYGRTHDHSDVDHLVVGHIHVPLQESFDGWTFTCLGDWVANFTVGRLRDGELEIVPVLDQAVRAASPP
jgi:UDP-2,3-diacylglucosamine hydrolase